MYKILDTVPSTYYLLFMYFCLYYKDIILLASLPPCFLWLENLSRLVIFTTSIVTTLVQAKIIIFHLNERGFFLANLPYSTFTVFQVFFFQMTARVILLKLTEMEIASSKYWLMLPWLPIPCTIVFFLLPPHCSSVSLSLTLFLLK